MSVGGVPPSAVASALASGSVMDASGPLATAQLATQRPPAHTEDESQRLPHVPQLSELVSTLTHVPLHVVWPGGQLSWQLPATHT